MAHTVRRQQVSHGGTLLGADGQRTTLAGDEVHWVLALLGATAHVSGDAAG